MHLHLDPQLLLSLAPDTDPLCALLLIDHFALRAKEYEWLVAFVAGFRQVCACACG